MVIVNGDRLQADNIKLYLTAANAVVIDAHIPSTAIPFGCPIFDGNYIGSVKDTQTMAMTWTKCWEAGNSVAAQIGSDDVVTERVVWDELAAMHASSSMTDVGRLLEHDEDYDVVMLSDASGVGIAVLSSAATSLWKDRTMKSLRRALD